MRQRTVSDYFWRDPQICDLSQEDKATLLYFLTSPSSNIVGVYQIVWGIAAAEMGWTKDQMVVVARRLKDKGLIDFSDTAWIWVKVWWNHNSARGAFSPKLLENAKRQCVAMPPEWLDEYIGVLELAGIDRVSIGYRYPNDTPPPNTTCISNFNTTTTTTTTTTTATELVFPEELSAHEKNSVVGLMPRIQFLPIDKQQELLDELAGAIRSKSIQTNSVSFFIGLISSVEKGPFIPSRGTKILEARTATKNRASVKLQVDGAENLDHAAMEKGSKLIRIPVDVQMRLKNVGCGVNSHKSGAV